MASLSTSWRPLVSTQRTAVAVVGVFAKAEIGDHQEFGRSRLARRMACWTMPSSRRAAEPRASL